VVAFALERGLPAHQLARFVPPRSQAPVAGASAHALWTFVSRSLEERALPWRVASRMRTADYGPYGFALQASDTSREALLRAARLLPAIATTIEFHLTSTARAARLTVHRRDLASSRGARIGTSFVVGQIARLLDAISDGATTPSSIQLSDATDAELATLGTSLPTAAVTRAATTSLEFSTASLDRPLPRRDPDLAAYFDEQLRQSLGPGGAPSLSAAVRRALDEHFALGRVPTEERIAAALAVGPRTLRRRLAAEGTSLRALLDEVRRDRAILELTRGDLSLVELAASLGFSDQSAFSRAFTRWTGLSPRAYRLRHAAAKARIFGSDLAERG
jgi:AraC-like DNA-binding protein